MLERILTVFMLLLVHSTSNIFPKAHSVYTCNSRKADDLLCINFEFLLNLQMTLPLSDIQNPMHAGIELLVNHLS